MNHKYRYINCPSKLYKIIFYIENFKAALKHFHIIISWLAAKVFWALEILGYQGDDTTSLWWNVSKRQNIVFSLIESESYFKMFDRTGESNPTPSVPEAKSLTTQLFGILKYIGESKGGQGVSSYSMSPELTFVFSYQGDITGVPWC